jgi:hypothetical protein
MEEGLGDIALFLSCNLLTTITKSGSRSADGKDRKTTNKP